MQSPEAEEKPVRRRDSTSKPKKQKSIKLASRPTSFKSDDKDEQQKKRSGCFHRFLTLIGVREEEDDVVSEEEKLRRYQIAMQGWKKVRRMLGIIRIQGADLFKGKSYQKKKTPWYTYEKLVILPFSATGITWKTIKAFFVLYNFLIVPYRVAFDNFGKGFVLADQIMDLILLFDIGLNFFGAYVQRTKIIKDKKSVIMHYLFGQFLIDLVCILPYYWMYSDFDERNSIYASRFFRFLQLFKTTHQMKIFWETILLKITSNINIIKSLSEILNFTIFLMIVGQVLASFWYSLGSVDEVDLGNNQIITGWIGQYFINDRVETDASTYISSIYWTYTTLSTLGYGDIYGKTNEEYLYTMGVEFIGVFIFAYMMSNINNLIQKLNDDHLEILEGKSEELDQWILKLDRANIDKKLPSELFDEIKNFFRNYWQKDHTMIHTDEPFLNQLPRDLRSKLIHYLFHKFMGKFKVFFEELQPAFVDEIVINLVPRKFSKDTDIIKIDHGAKYVYFITKGEVTICSTDAIEKYLKLGENSYFGEHLIFFNLKSSNAFRAVEGEVECMCIPKKKFQELCEEFPESAKILKTRAYLRRKHFRQAKLEVQNQNQLKLSKRKNNISLENGGITDRENGNDNETKRSEVPYESAFQSEIRKNEEASKEEQEEGQENVSNASNEQDAKESKRLLEYAKKLKHALDKIENQINHVEADLTKKMKNIKYYIGYISSIEDFINQN